jgi:hypothetical protein
VAGSPRLQVLTPIVAGLHRSHVHPRNPLFMFAQSYYTTLPYGLCLHISLSVFVTARIFDGTRALPRRSLALLRGLSRPSTEVPQCCLVWVLVPVPVWSLSLRSWVRFGAFGLPSHCAWRWLRAGLMHRESLRILERRRTQRFHVKATRSINE